MKKTEITLAIIFILITTYSFITIFVGWGTFGFGHSANNYYSQPPPSNATLWEKSQWEKYHGGVCTCVPVFLIMSSLQLYPSENRTFSKIFYNFGLHPAVGMSILDFTNTSYTISTRNQEKTVRFNDPSVNLTWYLVNGTPTKKLDGLEGYPGIMKNGAIISAVLDVEKMGFITPGLGPNERFSLVMTPPSGYRSAVTLTTPENFSLYDAGQFLTPTNDHL